MLTTVAYCCQSFEQSVRKAAGIAPFTCPPYDANTFDWRLLRDRDLIYFDLHGMPGRAEWYGDERIVALTTHHIKRADLSGTIIFAINCYLADEDSPMLDALLDAGAKYVIGGDGRNWAGSRSLFGASLLGLWFRRLLSWRVEPLQALTWAKRRVGLSLHQGMAAKDTMGFRAYYREKTT